MTAVQRSQAWAAEQKAFFDRFSNTPGAYLPAIYIEVGSQWAYVAPYRDTYLDGVEGAALNKTWAAIGQYNAGVN